MKKIVHIEGMSCGHCAARVEAALRVLDPGAQVDLAGNRALVSQETGDDALRRAVEDAGYRVVSIEC